MPCMRYVVSVDLGPAAAFTALAVVERTDGDDSAADPTFAARHLRRFPPGTPYRAVAADVGELLAAEELADASVAVDVTAVGTGVLDLFRDLAVQPTVVPMFVTAGHQAEPGTNGVAGAQEGPRHRAATVLQAGGCDPCRPGRRTCWSGSW